MENREYYNKLDELLSKTANGKEMYNNDALFRSCVESIVRGAEPISIIEQVCKINKDITDAHATFVMHSSNHNFKQTK